MLNAVPMYDYLGFISDCHPPHTFSLNTLPLPRHFSLLLLEPSHWIFMDDTACDFGGLVAIGSRVGIPSCFT